MKLFAVAMMAVRIDSPGGNVRAESMVGYVAKEDRDGAEGAGLRRARNEWPTADGWERHGATIQEIPTEVLEQVLKAGAK